MATETVTPNIDTSVVSGGDDTSASSVSSSSASESTSTANSSSSAVTPLSGEHIAATNQPTTATPSRPAKKEGESDLDFISRIREERQAAKAGTQEVIKPEEKAVQELRPKTEPTKEEVKPDKPAEQTADELDQLINEEDLALQEMGLMTPKDLNDLAKQSPELAKVFEASPEIKGRLMSTLRKAGEAAELSGIFPDKEAASFARDEATVFTGMRDQFVGQNSIADTRGILENIAKLTVQVDEDGNPVLDGKGVPVQDGSFFKFMENIRQIDMDYWRQQAEGSKDEEFLAALDLIRARTSRTAPASEEMPAELKSQWEKLNQERSALESQKQQEQTARQKASDERIVERVDQHFEKRWKEIETKFSAPKIVLEAVRDKLWKKIGEIVEQNPMFISQRDSLMRSAISQKSEDRRAQLITKYMDKVFFDAARPLLAEAGAQVMAQHAQKTATRQAMQQATRSEVKGAAAPAAPARPLTAKEFSEWAKKEHPDWDDSRKIAEWRQRHTG